MTWAELGTLGVRGYQAIEAGNVARANNRIRRAQNDISTTNAAAANWMRGVNNRAIAEAAAAQVEALKETQARTLDAQAEEGFAGDIAQMEAAGALAAGVAASGMAGVSVDILERTMGLRADIERESIKKNNGYVTYELTKQIAGTSSAGIAEQDFSTVLPQLDFRRDRTISPWTAIFTDKDSVKALGNLGAEISQLNIKFDWFGSRVPNPDAGSQPISSNLG